VEATVPQNLFLDKVLTNLEGIGTLPEEYTIQTNNDVSCPAGPALIAQILYSDISPFWSNPAKILDGQSESRVA